MNELIDALRYCGFDNRKPCNGCVLYDKTHGVDCLEKLHRDAADALEAAEKRIAELEKSYSWKAYAALEESIEGYKTRIAELEAQMPKWTVLKDEMPKPHTNVLVSGIEAINNSRVYKVMVNDNGTLRPTDYAPSIRWDYWMPFESPHCGARMGKENADADN